MDGTIVEVSSFKTRKSSFTIAATNSCDNIILCFLSNLDRQCAPDRSCRQSLWICILGLQKVLSDQPRISLVIAGFVRVFLENNVLVEEVLDFEDNVKLSMMLMATRHCVSQVVIARESYEEALKVRILGVAKT